MRKPTLSCKIGASRSTHNKICRPMFWKRIKTLLTIVVLSASICLYLKFVLVDYNVIEDSSQDMPWFRTHRNISEFLRLGENTYKVVPRNVKMWSDFSGNTSVVYFVASSPGNRVARHVVRNTWGSIVRPRPIFLVGYVDNATEMSHLYDEAKLYDDIIIENFVDTYRNLTLKTGFIFKHFIRLYPNAPYFMKTDDDVLVNPDVVTRIVEDTVSNKSSIYLPMIGKLYPSNTPHRDPDSKWYLPFWLYRRRYLPAYLSGTGYLVPGQSAQKILQNSIHVPLLPLEDVYFVGLVANEVTRLTLIGRQEFSDTKPIFSHYCNYRNLATLHHLETVELSSIWMQLYRSRDSCDGFFKNILKFIFY